MKANKKFSAYLTPEAVTCLDRLVYNACKSGVRTTQSEIISQSLIAYWHSLRLTKRLDDMPLPSIQMTHFENDDCVPPCQIEAPRIFNCCFQSMSISPKHTNDENCDQWKWNEKKNK